MKHNREWDSVGVKNRENLPLRHCCCTKCTWVVWEVLTFGNRLRSTHDREFHIVNVCRSTGKDKFKIVFFDQVRSGLIINLYTKLLYKIGHYTIGLGHIVCNCMNYKPIADPAPDTFFMETTFFFVSSKIMVLEFTLCHWYSLVYILAYTSGI